MRKTYDMRESDSEASREGSLLIDLSTPRGAGFALKRSISSDRENGGNGKHNGDRLEHRTREVVKLSYRSKSSQFRLFKGERIDGGFRKSNLELYKIAFSIIAICFLAITLVQGSVMLIVKHKDFLTIPGSEVSQISDTHRILLGAEGISDCERAVRTAVENFTGHLPLAAGFSEMWKLERNSRRPPRLALICPNLEEVPDTLYLITIARGLQWLGYDLELYAQQEGHMRFVWEDIGIPVRFVQQDWENSTIYWSNFEGVLAISLDAKKIVESLAQEPFTDIPVLWIIHENVVLDQDIAWNASPELQTVYRSWMQTFNRSSVLVFPNYFLPMVYNDFYNERFYVIPGSPWDVWEAEQYMVTHPREDARAKAGLSSDDYVIAVVGSPCTNKDIWREHAIVMNAVANLTSHSSVQQDGTLKRERLYILGRGNSTSGYENVLEMMAQYLGLGDEVIYYVGADEDVHDLLWMADTVVYASIWEELSFPPIVIQAMSFERPVIVPDLSAISQQIVDCHSGFLFPAGDDQALGQVLSLVRSNPILAHTVALEGASLARNLLAREAVVEYGFLLEKLLDFPEEAQLPRPMAEMQDVIPHGWRWDILSEPANVMDNIVDLSTVKDLLYLKSATDLRFVGNDSSSEDLETSVDDFDWLDEKDWSQEKQSVQAETWEQVEDDMMKDRLDGVRSSFEEVNKMAKKTETRVAQEKHLEIDNLEIERVAQLLCIYEPYQGPGAWSFLHRDHLLYHGLSLSAEGRRPFLNDVDGPRRLRLLNSSYYRDVLCDVAGFFAIAKLIDRVHWNSWIGFQPWRAVSRKVALTPTGEAALLAVISGEDNGDALYFWARLESKDAQPVDDFWNTCDSANAGNCRPLVVEAQKWTSQSFLDSQSARKWDLLEHVYGWLSNWSVDPRASPDDRFCAIACALCNATRTVFLDTFKEMYGLSSSWTQLLPMPAHGGTWAAMHCWAMPTTSFLEFVMFARMFVNALDSLQYDDHHERGRCCFKSSRVEVKHCYCNFLEGLVNIWAYHSARRMIYLDPESGSMQEQHDLEERKGTMWVKWFSLSLLKSMDEDLAEEADDEQSNRRWLWPETGEVFWAGTKEKERKERFEAKVEKKRRQLERQARQSKYRQRALGRYVKPKVAKHKIL